MLSFRVGNTDPNNILSLKLHHISTSKFEKHIITSLGNTSTEKWLPSHTSNLLKHTTNCGNFSAKEEDRTNGKVALHQINRWDEKSSLGTSHSQAWSLYLIIYSHMLKSSKRECKLKIKPRIQLSCNDVISYTTTIYNI